MEVHLQCGHRWPGIHKKFQDSEGLLPEGACDVHVESCVYLRGHACCVYPKGCGVYEQKAVGT